MKNLEVVNMGNQKPYPMYFTLRGKDGDFFTDTIKTHDGTVKKVDNKPVMGNYANGIAVITGAHTEQLEIGDNIFINAVKHTVKSIDESRIPNGNHQLNIMFFKITCSYTRFIG